MSDLEQVVGRGIIQREVTTQDIFFTQALPKIDVEVSFWRVWYVRWQIEKKAPAIARWTVRSMSVWNHFCCWSVKRIEGF